MEGFCSKSHDKVFLDYINEFHVICLCETWTDECVEINDYVKYVRTTQGNKTGERSRGRKAGGMVVYIRRNDNIQVEEIKSGVTEVMWVKLQIINITIIAALVYRHPDSSPYYNNNFFQLLQEEIEDIP